MRRLPCQYQCYLFRPLQLDEFRGYMEYVVWKRPRLRYIPNERVWRYQSYIMQGGPLIHLSDSQILCFCCLITLPWMTIVLFKSSAQYKDDTGSTLGPFCAILDGGFTEASVHIILYHSYCKHESSYGRLLVFTHKLLNGFTFLAHSF